jgi:chromate transporter
MILLELFLVFLKVGAVSFGGGYAMLAMIQNEIVSRNWCDTREFADMAAVAQMTPGPVAINTATYVGMKLGGIPGALIATLAFILPSLIVASLVGMIIAKLKDNPRFEGAMRGIRAASVGLIFAAVVFFAESSMFKSELPLNFSQWSAASFAAIAIIPVPVAVFALILFLVSVFKLKTIPAILLSLALGAAGWFFSGF